MKLRCAISSDLHYGQSEKTHELHDAFFRNLSEEKIDVLFLAGDLIASKQKSLDQFFTLLRTHLPNIKVLVVEGNHDRWNDDIYLSSKHYTESVPMYSPREVYKNRKNIENRKPMTWGEMNEYHKSLYKKYDLIHLDGSAHDLSNDIVAIGFDGWYNSTNIQSMGTNDYLFLPENIESAPAMIYLRNKAEKDLEKILELNTEGKTVIGMTHFPPFSKECPPIEGFHVEESWGANPRFLNFLTEKCDILIVGHNHHPMDLIYDDCRILNAGAPWDSSKRSYIPQYKIFEIKDE